jgi:hypothetical protein
MISLAVFSDWVQLKLLKEYAAAQCLLLAHIASAVGGRIALTFIHLWDTRMRLPAALRRARQTVGASAVNLNPQCFEPGVNIEPDIGAIYIASRAEVQEWAMSRGCHASFHGGQHRQLVCNVLIEITKPADIEADRMQSGASF